MSYLNLLLDKRWLQKRKSILARDNFQCVACGSGRNLRVHHTFYYKNRVNPWCYPNYSLETLCDTCHYNWHCEHEPVYKNNPIPKKKKCVVHILTEIEKMTLKYFEVETTSHSGKSLGCNYFYARNKEEALKIMKKRRLPVFGIKVIKRQK